MKGTVRLLALGVAVGLLVFPIAAGADHGTRPSTKNIHALGHSPHPATFFGATAAERNISSDLAFWGNLAVHGNYDGFRIVDISAPGNPKLVSHVRCNGDQGDVVVWKNIVVRSWNAPAPAGRFCDGQPVPVGFEGMHVFDISNAKKPKLLTSVEFSAAGAASRGTADGCGSHTSTLVPDLGNNRLIVYSNNSSGDGRAVCNAIDIVQVPLLNPAGASHIGKVPITGGSLGTNNGCHDAGVILGNVNLLACASGHAANVFSIGAPRGGSLTNPLFLYSVEEEEVHDGELIKVGAPAPPGQDVHHAGRWHSATFTWDGKVLILGWEPGGGATGECTEHHADITKSMFFYDTRDGSKLGQWVLPRNQMMEENCTIHNYNVVPLRSGKYVIVGGHYQAGTWVTEFTDPANPKTIAYADPPWLGTVTTPAGAVVNELGGAWSTYYYNNFIYESEITKGLHVFRLSDPVAAGALKLGHLNPQTQEFSLP
jgi:hypothetical protein